MEGQGKIVVRKIPDVHDCDPFLNVLASGWDDHPAAILL
jgi:hypothetical protein